MSSYASLATTAKAWPFLEARTLKARLDKKPKQGPVIFETGYGPSGLPHIGTFGEVARTAMVRHAFHVLTDGAIPTRLIAFSDDMDALRKIPDNVPNQAMLKEHLGKPLSRIPDPFEKYESFAHHNNAKLREFLDSFGFDYTFMSASEQYSSGVFDAVLRLMLERFDDVMAIMLPTLGEERRASYAPFLPVSPKTGCVLQTPILARNPEKGTITFEDEDGEHVEIPVIQGHVKAQWKADWALRWCALGVDYEMSGKDLIDSVKASAKICKALGGSPPAGFSYELFLDEKGQKISKSKGNGLSVEEWLSYGPKESLAYYMFQKPRTARRLFFDVIPKATDEYSAHGRAFQEQDDAKRLENPLWHIHHGMPPGEETPISFSLLLNLVSAANAQDKEMLWGFIHRYAPGTSPPTHPFLDKLVTCAMRYYEDFIAPHKNFRQPSDQECVALEDLKTRFEALDPGEYHNAERLQEIVYAVGKEHGFDPLKSWFQALYEILLGQSQGPRFGSFVALYGVKETIDHIGKTLRSQSV